MSSTVSGPATTALCPRLSRNEARRSVYSGSLIRRSIVSPSLNRVSRSRGPFGIARMGDTLPRKGDMSPFGACHLTGAGLYQIVAFMLLREVEYARPDSIGEAVRLLGSHEGARALAGGQTLVNGVKARAAAPDGPLAPNALGGLRAIP